jgi:hypothetical protein
VHLLLFFIIQFIAVFQTKVKGTDRRLEFTEQPDCMLAPSESLTNSKYKREYDSDTENNQVNIVAKIKSQAKVRHRDAQERNYQASVIHDIEVFLHWQGYPLFQLSNINTGTRISKSLFLNTILQFSRILPATLRIR